MSLFLLAATGILATVPAAAQGGAPAPLAGAHPSQQAQRENAAESSSVPERRMARPARWFFQPYYALGTFSVIEDFPLGRIDPAPSHLFVLSGGRELVRLGRWATLEAEALIGRHTGLNRHWEYAAGLNFRWEALPWDRYLDTSFAFSEGLSYATEVPALEEDKNASATRLLNFNIYEVALARPAWENIAVFFRVHHRSGMWGTFDGVVGGSNFIGAGLRWYWTPGP